MCSESNSLKDINVNIVPKCVEKPVENVLDPPSKAIGETLSDVWAIVFGDRISYLRKKSDLKYAAALEQYQKDLASAASKIPPQKRVEPDFQTASQALDDSKYCVENTTLREMFVRLITATMDADTQESAHPAFSGIIKQMSTADAILFRTVYQRFENGYMPMVTPQLRIGETDKYVTGAFPFWFSGLDIAGCDMYQLSRSFFSLQRLGLMNLMHRISLSNPHEHVFLYKHPALIAVKEKLATLYPNQELHIMTENSVGHITDFGTAFACCCL